MVDIGEFGMDCQQEGWVSEYIQWLCFGKEVRLKIFDFEMYLTLLKKQVFLLGKVRCALLIEMNVEFE